MLRKSRRIIEVVLFFIVAAMLYLPFAKELGYYNDDWYTMYSARVAGTGIFSAIYTLERPARAFLMAPLYTLFKGFPFYYSLSAYFLRVLGALSFLWLLRLLWGERKNESFLAALLFLIYPGFLDMPIAIDFQSHLLAMTCALISLGLTVKFLEMQGKPEKLLLWLGAVLLGWVYLSQMEYYIGFELVRMAILGLFFLRKSSWKKAIVPTLKIWLLYAIIPVAFVFWRQFIFDNQRKVTELGAQFGKLLTEPTLTLYSWIVNFVQSFLNVLVLAWGEPFSRLGFSLSVGKSLIALTLALGVMLLVFAFFHYAGKENAEKLPGSVQWSQEAFWLGLAWVVFGILPVILANRSVSLVNYSRYGFVSSGGAVLVLAVLLAQLKQRRFQAPVLAFLILSAVFTHYGNGMRYAQFTNDLRSFWWQTSWRVPQFEEGTTLIANYPHGGIRESSFVWGPANQIYYADPQSGDKVKTGINALVLNRETISKIWASDGAFLDKYLVVRTFPDPGDVLIVTQPSPDSCVQIIDGMQPEYSEYEREEIMLIGEYSDPSHVLLDADSHTPPAFLFGDEPKHGWCYFYEMAALARQRGDWDEVYALDAEASEQGSVPKDQIELMPFLQSYIHFDDVGRLTKVAKEIKNNRFVRDQACEILMGMRGTSTEAAEVVEVKICYHP